MRGLFANTRPGRRGTSERPAGRGVGHAAGDDQHGVERDDLLRVGRGQRDVPARHVAYLEDAVEDGVARRIAPLEPAVLAGVDAEVERPVAAPGVGGDRRAGHGIALPVDDLAAQRVPRPEPEFQRGPILGVDLPQVGREALGPAP